jgi:hypothetical protein
MGWEPPIAARFYAGAKYQDPRLEPGSAALQLHLRLP